MVDTNLTTSFPLNTANSEILEQSLEYAAVILAEDIARSLDLPKIPISYVAGKEYLRSDAQKTGGKLKLPAAAIQIRNIKQFDGGYNAFALRHLGAGGIKTDRIQRTVTKYSLCPVLVTCNFHFISQDHKDVIRFTKNWITNLRRAFEISGPDGFELGIGLKREKSIDVSDVELENMTPLFDLETNVEIWTFTGNLVKTPLVQSVNTQLHVVNQPATEQQYMDMN